ncbi:MAG: hypothetical protein E7598_04615 [Ruminococcaceae bacterium]|nr:hypothetical protein [Oscillospiraceae bacterium]
MKRHGRFLSLILAVMLAALMLVSASGLEIFIIASSDEYLGYSTSASYLETVGVMQGYGDGDLHLEEPIQRYQAALFFARLVTGVTNDTAWGEGASEKYKDVPEYGAVIDMISDLEIIRGYGNEKFGYSDGIRYQDMCAMLLRALGYETEDMVKAYPMSYVLKVKDLGLDLKDVKPSDYLNRGQTAQMVYDALTTEIIDAEIDENPKIQAIIEAVREDNGRPAPVDSEKETYLERNFNVSSTMYFQIIATENYSAAPGFALAEEGYISVWQLTADNDGVMNGSAIWTFPVEGTATADVSEADLIGKCLKVVFDDKEPSNDKLADEECAIVHADIVESVKYENLGELSYVKFDEDNGNLILGNKTVKAADLNKYATIWQYGTNAAEVVVPMVADELDTAIERNTYFALECYDFNGDGNYDNIVYKPYSFAQYAERTYSGTKYVMLGKYYEDGVYDMTEITDKTSDNFTHFVEYFLGKNAVETSVASKSYDKYTPGNTALKVSESMGKLSANVTVTGDDIAHGDFMLYYYNPLVNKLEVVENLGTYQYGAITGYKSGAQTYTLDGSATSVGLPGTMIGNIGLLVGDGAFASTLQAAKQMVANYEKGNDNAKYLEYDGKIIYLEAYGDSDIVVGSDFVIVDIEETFEKCLEADEDAIDISFEGESAIVSVLDVATGKFNDTKVESVTYLSGEDVKTFKFANWENKQALAWDDKEVYNIFDANGVIYAALDEDEDEELELYAYGTKQFKILGASPVAREGDAASVYFTYNKSTEYVAENNVGVSVERVSTNDNTVSVVIAQDGYVMVKGKLGNFATDGQGNVVGDENRLWLSTEALILESVDNQITIYDPMGHVAADADSNVYNKLANSIWNVSYERTPDNSGISYYIMLENSLYNGSSVMINGEGDPVKNDDGDILYTHEYKGLYNLVTGSSENVTLVTDSGTAPATDVINSIKGVIRYDAENNEAALTTYGEVFVTNGDYHYGGFAWLAAKDRINFTTQPKDKNGDGRITGDEKGKSVYYNADEDKVYDSLNTLNVTFIDLDAGAAVDPDEHSFTDAYVFYRDAESDRKVYAAVDLEDREPGIGYPAGTFPIRRHTIDAKDVSGSIGNGRITSLTAGKSGLIASPAFFRWNGWCDYLIPPVNEEGDVVWTYEGSTRIKVTYYSYINYDEDAKAVDAVVVRVGVNGGIVGADDTIPAVKNEPTDPSYNFTEE